MNPISRRKRRRSRPPMNLISRKRRSYPITRKRNRSSVHKADDRLSQLPDELLITILSSTLTLKEAAATSILSKRWKTLWTYYYGFLDFDYHLHLPFEKTYYRQIEKCSCEYVNYVNKVLRSHRGFPINKLRICWRLRDEYKSVIDSWIDFATKKRVQHLELDLCLPVYKSKYKFPHGIGFPNLIVLHLSSVDLNNETLAYLISSDKCPSLQHISVISAPSLLHVKVVGNLKLKSLEIDKCWSMKDVEISSVVNLMSFGFSGKKDTKITFEDVPRLTEARFGLDYCKNVVMQPLSSPLSQLEVLVLDLSCFGYRQTVSLSSPKFNRVKRLVLQSYTPYSKIWNKCVMGMIYKCPRLQKFSLVNMNYRGTNGAGPIEMKFQHRHECLRDVEYKGWNGNEDDLDLVSDILKNTVLLDKVTIDPRITFSHKFHEMEAKFRDPQFHIHDKNREEAARKAAEKLIKVLPQRVTLVIL